MGKDFDEVKGERATKDSTFGGGRYLFYNLVVVGGNTVM